MSATRLVLLSVMLLGAALSLDMNTKYYYELHGDMELTEDKVRQMYVDYSEQYSKFISFGAESRLGIFEETLKTIAAHNANPKRTWEMGITEFTDITDQEFFATHLGAA